MVPGITERERRIADDVRWDWLGDTRNRCPFHAMRQYGLRGPHRDLMTRGRFRGPWPAPMLHWRPRLAQVAAGERALG
jgi:hypothetical protein